MAISQAIFQFVAGLVAPDGINIEASREPFYRSGESRRLRPRLEALQPGDIVLVRTPGNFYRLIRNTTLSDYDHLAVVMTSTEFLHIGPPTVRLLPTSIIMAEQRCAVAFRPEMTDAERKELLATLHCAVGQAYDTGRTYRLIARCHYFLATSTWTKMPLASNSKHICTDSIIRPILACCPRLATAVNRVALALDEPLLGSFTLNDVVRLQELLPGLLPEVKLPTVDRAYRPQDEGDGSDLSLLSFFSSPPPPKYSHFRSDSTTSRVAVEGFVGTGAGLTPGPCIADRPARGSLESSLDGEQPIGIELATKLHAVSSFPLAAQLRERIKRQSVAALRRGLHYSFEPSVLFINVFSLARQVFF
jgi:hypothetical protein